jgi:hypothetical protein
VQHRSVLGGSAGRDYESSIRDSGAIDKGVRDVIGRGGAVIGCFQIRHFQDFAEDSPREE